MLKTERNLQISFQILSAWNLNIEFTDLCIRFSGMVLLKI